MPGMEPTYIDLPAAAKQLGISQDQLRQLVVDERIRSAARSSSYSNGWTIGARTKRRRTPRHLKPSEKTLMVPVGSSATAQRWRIGFLKMPLSPCSSDSS